MRQLHSRKTIFYFRKGFHFNFFCEKISIKRVRHYAVYERLLRTTRILATIMNFILHSTFFIYSGKSHNIYTAEHAQW